MSYKVTRLCRCGHLGNKHAAPAPRICLECGCDGLKLPFITEIYQKYEAIIDGHSGDGFMKLNFGPAHIVWEDNNMETHHIEWAIQHAEEFRQDMCNIEFDAVVGSLRELLTVPEEVRLREVERA